MGKIACRPVSSCKVEAQPPGSGGDEEQEDRGRGVELIHLGLPILLLGGTIQTQVHIASHDHHALYDVQHTH